MRTCFYRSIPHRLRLWSLIIVLAGSVLSAFGQAVIVTLRLDTNMIPMGGLTTLHVDARIIPGLRATSDRIFSWYVDVLNTNANAAVANYGVLQKTTSDNDPTTSSTGLPDGNHRRGIHDTFLDRPSAGRDASVELMSIPITGLNAGLTRFRVQAGTRQPELSADFYVASNNGDGPYLGGDYANAYADLRVTSQTAPARLSIAQTNVGSGLNRVTIRYEVQPGTNYFIEVRSNLSSGPDWQTVPGGPFNSGIYVETNNVASRFYRARLGP